VKQEGRAEKGKGWGIRGEGGGRGNRRGEEEGRKGKWVKNGTRVDM